MTGRRQVFRVGQLLCGLFVGAMLAWYVWLEPPRLEYVNLPFPVSTPVVKAGQSVLFDIWRYNHSGAATIVLKRWIVNVATNEKTELLGTEISMGPGFTSKPGKPTVPHSIGSGIYRICGTTTMPATLPRITRTIPWCTDTFQVVADPEIFPTAEEAK